MKKYTIQSPARLDASFRVSFGCADASVPCDHDKSGANRISLISVSKSPQLQLHKQNVYSKRGSNPSGAKRYIISFPCGLSTTSSGSLQPSNAKHDHHIEQRNELSYSSNLLISDQNNDYSTTNDPVALEIVRDADETSKLHSEQAGKAVRTINEWGDRLLELLPSMGVAHELLVSDNLDSTIFVSSKSTNSIGITETNHVTQSPISTANISQNSFSCASCAAANSNDYSFGPSYNETANIAISDELLRLESSELTIIREIEFLTNSLRDLGVVPRTTSSTLLDTKGVHLQADHVSSSYLPFNSLKESEAYEHSPSPTVVPPPQPVRSLMRSLSVSSASEIVPSNLPDDFDNSQEDGNRSCEAQSYHLSTPKRSSLQPDQRHTDLPQRRLSPDPHYSSPKLELQYNNMLSTPNNHEVAAETNDQVAKTDPLAPFTLTNIKVPDTSRWAEILWDSNDTDSVSELISTIKQNLPSEVKSQIEINHIADEECLLAFGITSRKGESDHILGIVGNIPVDKPSPVDYYSNIPSKKASSEDKSHSSSRNHSTRRATSPYANCYIPPYPLGSHGLVHRWRKSSASPAALSLTGCSDTPAVSTNNPLPVDAQSSQVFVPTLNSLLSIPFGVDPLRDAQDPMHANLYCDISVTQQLLERRLQQAEIAVDVRNESIHIPDSEEQRMTIQPHNNAYFGPDSYVPSDGGDHYYQWNTIYSPSHLTSVGAHAIDSSMSLVATNLDEFGLSNCGLQKQPKIATEDMSTADSYGTFHLTATVAHGDKRTPDQGEDIIGPKQDLLHNMGKGARSFFSATCTASPANDTSDFLTTSMERPSASSLPAQKEAIRPISARSLKLPSFVAAKLDVVVNPIKNPFLSLPNNAPSI